MGRKGYQAWLAGKWPRSEWAVKKPGDGWRDSWVIGKPPALATGGSGGRRVPPPKNPVPGAVGGPGAPKPGRVTRDRNVQLEEHEVVTGHRLASLGIDVHFRKPTGLAKTADAFILGESWEIKTPLGASDRTIRNNLRAAFEQGDRVIIDLFRTALTLEAAISQVSRYWGDRRASGLQSLDRVWLLQKNVVDHITRERS